MMCLLHSLAHNRTSAIPLLNCLICSPPIMSLDYSMGQEPRLEVLLGVRHPEGPLADRQQITPMQLIQGPQAPVRMDRGLALQH